MHPQQEKAKEKNKAIGKEHFTSLYSHGHSDSTSISAAQQPIISWHMGNATLMSATQIKHTSTGDSAKTTLVAQAVA